MSVLDEILDRTRAAAGAGQTPVAVFDLDSTLFSTQPRNWAILQEFAQGSRVPPLLKEKLATLRSSDMRWNAMDDLRRNGFADESTLQQLRDFWFLRFFRDEYLAHDVPLPGATEFVREMHAAGATVYYLTGRDEPNMGKGTRRSLVSHGFPFEEPRVHLRLKPMFEEHDLGFKQRVIAELGRAGQVVVCAENEPANANMFFAAFPDAHHLLLETVCSPHAPPLAPGIHRVKDFVR